MGEERPAELIEFGGYPTAIRARVGVRLRSTVGPLLNGWSVANVGDTGAPPHLVLRDGENSAVEVSGRWVGQTYKVTDPADIACGFIAELLKAQANESSGSFCIHSAAAIVGGRAVVFPATFRSGKSVLVSVLAARGLKVMADDAVFISPETGEAVSPGISPRVRLPLPTSLSLRTSRYIAGAMQLQGKRYAYLSLSDAIAMPNGQRAPIGALVYLKRMAEGKAALTEMPKSAALKALVWQNFARRLPAGQILTFLAGLVASRPTLELVYSEAEDAADVLERTFSQWSPKYSPDVVDFGDDRHWPGEDDGVWRAKPGIVERNLNGDEFIADEDTGRVFHLNATASAIWRMLSAGDSTKAISSVMCEAFPDVDRDRISHDVDTISRSLRENGLLVATTRP